MNKTIKALKDCAWNQTHAAAQLGISRSAIRDRVAKLRRQGNDIPTFKPATAAPDVSAVDLLKSAEAKIDTLESDVKRLREARRQPIPQPKARKREKEDRIGVIWPDVHGAKQDPAAVSAFLGDVKRLDPDILVGLGDLADCGGFMGAHHVLGFVAETSDTYEEDIEAANQFLDSVQQAAPHAKELHLIEGNHEHRVEKWAITAALRNPRDAAWLRNRVAPDVLLNATGRGARYYRRAETYDGMQVQGAFRIGKLGVMHGILNGNGTPDQVLNKFGMSMVYGHTHKIASKVRRATGGPIGAWNLGTLAKLQQYYAHGSPTDHAHGYGLFFMSRSGNFQMIPVSIVDGVSLLPELTIK